MLAVGSLNKRITLLAPSTTQGVDGELGAETVFAICWAAIDSISGQNIYQQQYVSESTHKIAIRYRASVVPNMRVQFGTRFFTILYIANPQERNESLDLFCQETL